MIPAKKYTLFFLAFALLGMSCGKRSAVKEWINQPANGYIQEVKTNAYILSIQYQPPVYRADQEIIVNKSSVSRRELIGEYDNLQQFVVKYKMEPGLKADVSALAESFTLIAQDTLPCVDAHNIPYSPGSPWHEMTLLFPLTEKEMGNDFTLDISGFPQQTSHHKLVYHLNRKD
jgi:hypothetical protein